MRMKHQIVVRVSEDLHARLLADAEANGRTLAQSVRFLLQRGLTAETTKLVPTKEEFIPW